MFRSSSQETNTQIDNCSAFNGLGGLNMYLDTSTKHNMSPPMSSATLSPPMTPLTPEPTIASTQFPLLTDTNQLNTTANTLLLQRQYQYHLLIQHHQQQLALAQHQWALAASAAAASHQQKDEIAHSLKMFAFFTSCNSDSGSGSTQDAMQDFASNGYVSDDFNRYQHTSQSCPTPQPQQPSQMPRQQFPSSTTGACTSTAAAADLTANHLMNLNNYREHLNNVWRSMSMAYMPNNIAASPGIPMASGSQKNMNPVGMALPPDHMRNVNNVNITNNNNNRQPKRYNQKSKEHVPRHCVFCENNNEPEAVVNSHSVRDTYGRVLCPKLRTYVCPICGASGDSAHTIKYCPKKPIVTMEDAIKAESFRLAKSNYYKQQMKV